MMRHSFHWHPLVRAAHRWNAAHPHHFHHWYYRYGRRRPSRLLWFSIGAATALFWGRYKFYHDNFDRGRHWGHCIRPPIQVPSHFPDSPGQTSTPEPRTERRSDKPNHQFTLTKVCEQMDAEWEKDKDRLMALSKQAQDAMSDLSESTLDSVLKSLESMKSKLVEQRLEREKQQKALEESEKKSSRWF